LETGPVSRDDFIGAFADWHFEWLDVPAFIRAADSVLEFPMVRSGSAAALEFLNGSRCLATPRIRWCRAAPTGAGQAILDARGADGGAARKCRSGPQHSGFTKSSAWRRTTRIVLTNRTNPPDAILREVFQRTQDKPFNAIEESHQPRGKLVGPVRRLQADRRLFEGSACAGENLPALEEFALA